MKWLLAIGAAAILPVLAGAEDAVLFSGASTDLRRWQCDDTLLDKEGDVLVLREASKQIQRCGNAYTKFRLPYFSKGEFILDVKRVHGGSYSLQLLFFEGEKLLGSADLLRDASFRQKRRFQLDRCDAPEGTDSLVPKLWITGGEGASMEIAEVSYAVPVPRKGVLLDETFTAVPGWDAENLEVATLPGGIRLSLGEGFDSGSLLCPVMLDRQPDAVVLLRLGDVTGGTVSVQCVCFDEMGNYLASRDVINKALGGWHAGRLDEEEWPEGTASFQLKTWIAGIPASSAQLARLMVVERR